MLLATVPEASVDKERYFGGGKDEVRMPQKAVLAAPPNDSVFTKNLDQ